MDTLHERSEGMIDGRAGEWAVVYHNLDSPFNID